MKAIKHIFFGVNRVYRNKVFEDNRTCKPKGRSLDAMAGDFYKAVHRKTVQNHPRGCEPPPDGPAGKGAEGYCTDKAQARGSKSGYRSWPRSGYADYYCGSL